MSDALGYCIVQEPGVLRVKFYRFSIFTWPKFLVAPLLPTGTGLGTCGLRSFALHEINPCAIRLKSVLANLSGPPDFGHHQRRVKHQLPIGRYAERQLHHPQVDTDWGVPHSCRAHRFAQRRQLWRCTILRGPFSFAHLNMG